MALPFSRRRQSIHVDLPARASGGLRAAARIIESAFRGSVYA